MASINKQFTFENDTVIKHSDHNTNFDTIYNDYNGNITNFNIAAGAAIVDTKLAQISTASKVTAAAIVGTPWAEGMIINGFEIDHANENDTGITVSPGLILHGTTQVKTTASTAAILDTAGNYFDGNRPTYLDELSGGGNWNYIGIDTSGTMKLLGHVGQPTILSYTTDGTQGTQTKSQNAGEIPIYFWDSGNSKHWRVIGQIRCYEHSGDSLIKNYYGQSQQGADITLDSAIAASGAAALAQTSFTEINMRSVIASTSQIGYFVSELEGSNGATFFIRNADAIANPGDPAGKNFVTDTGTQIRTTTEFIQNTDSSQAIDYKLAGTGASTLLKLTGYRMRIRL